MEEERKNSKKKYEESGEGKFLVFFFDIII